MESVIHDPWALMVILLGMQESGKHNLGKFALILKFLVWFDELFIMGGGIIVLLLSVCPSVTKLSCKLNTFHCYLSIWYEDNVCGHGVSQMQLGICEVSVQN